MSLAMSVVPLVLAPFLPKLQRAFSPVVAGTVVLLIGLLLIPTSMFGIGTPLPGGGSPARGLLAAGVVLALVVGLNALRFNWARLSAALLALLGGYLLCLLIGGVQAPVGGAWFALPRPLKYGLSFDPSFILPFGFVYSGHGHRNAGRPHRLLRAFRRADQRPRSTGSACAAACLPTA